MILDMNISGLFVFLIFKSSIVLLYLCLYIDILDIKKIFRYLITQYFSRFIKILNVNEINEF